MFTFLPIALPCFFALYLFETVLGIEEKKKWKDARISGVREFTSCFLISDLILPAVLPTLVPLSWKFEVSWLTKCIRGQAKNLMQYSSSNAYYGYASVPKWSLKQSQTIWFLKIFLGKHAPNGSLVLHAYACIHLSFVMTSLYFGIYLWTSLLIVKGLKISRTWL